MRRIALLLAAGVLAPLACTPAPARIPPPAPPPPPGGTSINVLPLSGVTYRKTATLTMGVIDLIPCTTPGVGMTPVPVDVVDTMISHTVASGRGDQMVLPARSAPRGTRVSLERQAGAYRSVRAYASAPVKNARISIDITDCTLPAGKRLTVVREVSPDVWEDVGGSVASGKITTPPLPHLSIYALAGGN